MFRPKTVNPKAEAGKNKYTVPVHASQQGQLLGTSKDGKSSYRLIDQQVIRVTGNAPSFVGTLSAFQRKVQSGAIEFIPV